ncbi:MAG TPA: TonB-dependent receptor [Parafilimonas sp.]|nr:TonB-dependent receptor [Parafilimonas sp.]
MANKITVLFFFLSFFTVSTFAQQNNGNIKGTVTTNDSKPAALVTIHLSGTKKYVQTNDDGTFKLSNVAEGNYTLEVSLIGYETLRQNVSIKANQTSQVNMQLQLSQQQLQDVIVTTNRNANDSSYYVAKIPLKNLENPQAYQTVSANLIKQQGLTNFDDALRNVPGVARTWESTGRSGDGTAYFAMRGFEAQTSLTNGLPAFTTGDMQLGDIEEIQVLKGPSGTLYGANFYGYGGIINIITKKPYFTTGGEITYNLGSFQMNQISADINTPLSKTEKIALRVNTSYHSENSFQDAGYKKSFFIAPSLRFEVNDKLSFDFLAEVLQEERAVAPVFFNTNRTDPLTAKNIRELDLDTYQSFTSNDLPMKNPRFNTQLQMNYTFNHNWTSQTAISKTTLKSDGYYGYIFGNDYGSNIFEQDIHKENYTTSITDIQQNFNGDFKIGSLRNRLLIGLDYYNQNNVDNGTGYALMRYVTPQGEIIQADDEHPVYATQESVDSLLASSGNSNSNSSNSTYAFYVSDVINFTKGLSVMASVRGDYFVSKGEKNDPSDDFNQFAWSPKFGIVYQPILNKLSLFANYMNTFLNVAPFEVTDADGSNPHIKSFKPEHANQLEFGIKSILFTDKLTGTISYYDIKLENRVTPKIDNINDYDQRGKVRSRGIEFDINANPAPGLTITAGYSHNHIENTSDNGTDFYTEKGRNPGGQGPQDLVNFWATYKINSGALKNFGFGAGGNYAGIYKVIDNSVVGVFELPSYTLLNASLFYNSGRMQVSFNGNNLADKKYYIGYWSVNPQRPINFTASIAFKF